MAEGSDSSETIELPRDFLVFAEERVRAGEYSSVAEVARAAFRLIREQQLGAGNSEDLGEVFREMEEAIASDEAHDVDEEEALEPTDDEVQEAAPPTTRQATEPEP